MIITDVATIERILEEDEYEEYCTIYCCLPLSVSRLVFDLRFYANSTHLAQTLFCGFREKYTPLKSCDE